MKHLFTIFCALICSSMKAQNADITLVGFQGKKVYVGSLEYRNLSDSINVTTHTYKYKSPLDMEGELAFWIDETEDSPAHLISDKSPITITLANGKTTVTGGSKLHRKFATVHAEIKTQEQEYEKILADYSESYKNSNDNRDSLISRVRRQATEWNLKFESTLTKVFNDYRKTIIPCAYMSDIVNFKGLEYIAEYLQSYPYADRSSLESIRKQVEAEKVKAPGAKVIDFVMDDLQGNPVHLTDWVGKGNYVLVDFWASWCGPCKAEMPTVKTAYEKYHPKGFEIVGVSFDNNKNSWQKAVTDLGITWPQMSDLKYWKSEAVNLYNIHAIPATILYDPEGRVVASNLRGEKLLETLTEIYK